MTKVQTKAIVSPFTCMSVNELIALAKAEPAKLDAIQTHATAKLIDLTARTSNSAKLNAWRSIVDGSLTGWASAAKPKAVEVTKPKAVKVTRKPKVGEVQEVLSMLRALIKSM